MTAQPPRQFVCFRCGAPLDVVPIGGYWLIQGLLVIAAAGMCVVCGAVWQAWPRVGRRDD